MPTNRNVVFAKGENYYVFNRGVERRPVFTTKESVLSLFSTVNDYKRFVLDHAAYARELEKIKHLILNKRRCVGIKQMEGEETRLNIIFVIESIDSSESDLYNLITNPL
jgi:hypothetical protein